MSVCQKVSFQWLKQRQPLKGKTALYWSLRCRRQNYNFYFHRMLKMQIIIIQIINIQMIGVFKVRAVGLAKGSQETGSNKFDSCSSINFHCVQIWLLFCSNLVLLRCVGVGCILTILLNIESSPTLFNIKTSNWSELFNPKFYSGYMKTVNQNAVQFQLMCNVIINFFFCNLVKHTFNYLLWTIDQLLLNELWINKMYVSDA